MKRHILFVCLIAIACTTDTFAGKDDMGGQKDRVLRLRQSTRTGTHFNLDEVFTPEVLEAALYDSLVEQSYTEALSHVMHGANMSERMGQIPGILFVDVQSEEHKTLCLFLANLAKLVALRNQDAARAQQIVDLVTPISARESEVPADLHQQLASPRNGAQQQQNYVVTTGANQNPQQNQNQAQPTQTNITCQCGPFTCTIL